MILFFSYILGACAKKNPFQEKELKIKQSRLTPAYHFPHRGSPVCILSQILEPHQCSLHLLLEALGPRDRRPHRPFLPLPLPDRWVDRGGSFLAATVGQRIACSLEVVEGRLTGAPEPEQPGQKSMGTWGLTTRRSINYRKFKAEQK